MNCYLDMLEKSHTELEENIGEEKLSYIIFQISMSVFMVSQKLSGWIFHRKKKKDVQGVL